MELVVLIYMYPSEHAAEETDRQQKTRAVAKPH
jgi:hypothetical protein